MLGCANSARHSFVRVAEWQALLDQIVRQVRRRGMAFERGTTHCVGHRLYAGDKLSKNRQRVGQGIDRVESALLVLLIVLIVGKWLALHQGNKCDEVPYDARCLAAREFWDVGVLFLRHDR